MLIIGGAASNFVDRLLFGVTIDYIRILTSIINLGDVMIVVGGLLLLAKINNETDSVKTPPL